MMKLIFASLLWSYAAVAGLPPTSTQGSAGGGYRTTFQFNFPGFPLSYTGTRATLGTLTVGGGGTGQTSYTDGQLLIGDTTSGGLVKSTLTAGSGITITNGGGSVTIAAPGATQVYGGFSLSGSAVDNTSKGGAWGNVTNATWATKTFHGTAVVGSSANDLSFIIPSLPAGAYMAVTNAQGYSVSGQVCRFAMYDGINRNGISADSNLASAVDSSVIGAGYFYYSTTQTNIEFRIQMFSSNSNCGVRTADQTAETTFFLVRIGS